MARARIPMFVAALVLSACVSAAPIAHKTEAIAVVRAPQAKTYDAVLDLFSHMTVDSADRSAGLLKLSFGGSGYLGMCYNTAAELRATANDWDAAYHFSSDEALDIWGGIGGTNRSGRAVIGRTQFTVSITGDTTNSTVRLAANWFGTDDKPLSHCELTHYWDSGFQDAIRGRAETRTPFWHKAQP